MEENDISYLARKAIFKVYNTLGPGLFESVYAASLLYELQELGLSVRKEVAIPMVYKDLKFEAGFRIDIIINQKVIIEIKFNRNYY